MATGRLWDEHLRHLGYPPKFYRVQDAISGKNSRFWCNFRIILMKNHQNLCFRAKVTFEQKEKNLPGSLQTVVRSGDAPQMVAFSKLGTGKFKTFFNQNPAKFNEFHWFGIDFVFELASSQFWKREHLGCFPTSDDCLQASWQGPFFFFWVSLLPENTYFDDLSLKDPKITPTTRNIARIGILDPIKFWWVP